VESETALHWWSASPAVSGRCRPPVPESELPRPGGQFAKAVVDARRLVREDLPVRPGSRHRRKLQHDEGGVILGEGDLFMVHTYGVRLG
jgi:hypothetical protein